MVLIIAVMLLFTMIYVIIDFRLFPRFSRLINFLNINMLQTAQNAKYLKQPDHDNDYNYSIKNVFDGSLHWNVSIHKPENYSCNNQNDDYC